MSLDPLMAVAPEKQTRSRLNVTWQVKLGVLILLLVVAFAKPLFDLVRFSTGSDLYSHILLVPAISFYLAWMKRRQLSLDSSADRKLAILPIGAGLALVAGYWIGLQAGWKPVPLDYLSLMTAAFVCLFVGGCWLAFGGEALRPLAFPLGFLVFMIPFPQFLENLIESLLQHGSAEVTYWLFKLTGMPVMREGTHFQLPGFSMQVAPQCSGIHSSLVLFISAMLAGYMLLRSPWSRTALAVAVIPLALLRNGLRIVTLGQLCVRVDPEMINSVLHRRGGPLFFALSLVPFFLLLLFLRKWESKRIAKPS